MSAEADDRVGISQDEALAELRAWRTRFAPRRAFRARAALAGIASLGFIGDSRDSFRFLREAVLGRGDSSVFFDLARSFADVTQSMESWRSSHAETRTLPKIDPQEIERIRAQLREVQLRVKRAQQEAEKYHDAFDEAIHSDNGEPTSFPYYQPTLTEEM